MSTWPKAVFFDFDGVIVNSEPLHFQAFYEVMAAEHIELTEGEYYGELIGFDDRGAIKQIYAKRNKVLDPKTFLRLMTHKSEKMMELIHRKQFGALAGVEEFVRGLWRNYPLAICSGALRDEIEAMLEGVCLRDCFSVIVAAEDCTVGKPDPEGYLMTTRLMSEKTKTLLKPEDCLVVEDAPIVAASIRKVGFSVLGVATTYPAEKLSAANWVVESLRPEEVKKKIPSLKLMDR